jgi:hypothetical protein
MVKINFTGAGQYWLSSPEPPDGNGGVAGGGALWIDLGECETEADVLAVAHPVLCHEHGHERLTRDRTAGLKVFDDREGS